MWDEGLDLVVVDYRTPRLCDAFVESWRAVRDEAPTTLRVVHVGADRFEKRTVEPGLWEHWIERNVGYGRACNWAANLGTRETVAFFNADTELRSDVLAACWRSTLEDGVAVVGPRQVDERGRLTHAGMFGSNVETRPRGWMAASRGQFDEVRDDAVTVSGAAFFVARSAWDEMAACPVWRGACPDAVGAMLEAHYYSETWVSYHVRAHGWKVRYQGDVSMVHLWHRSSPVGGPMDAKRQVEREHNEFRRACGLHGILCD